MRNITLCIVGKCEKNDKWLPRSCTLQVPFSHIWVFLEKVTCCELMNVLSCIFATSRGASRCISNISSSNPEMIERCNPSLTVNLLSRVKYSCKYQNIKIKFNIESLENFFAGQPLFYTQLAEQGEI